MASPLLPPTITPFPQPTLISNADLPNNDGNIPTPTTGENVLDKRQQVVTLSVTATPSTSAAVTTKKGFPVAVAIPALVGGMALAIGGFLLYWWISKRRRREKRLRWERHQKRQARKRAGSNANGRPSISSSRNPSAGTTGGGGQKSPINEKGFGFVPPVPALPKHAHQPDAYQQQHQPQHQNKLEQAYGYGKQPQTNHYEHADHAPGYTNNNVPAYAPQLTIEQQQYQQFEIVPVTEHSRSDSQSSTAPLTTTVSEKEEVKESTKQPGRPSRSAARIAVAEKAAETAFGDPTTRYQPKKPSPLALKAAEEKKRLALGGFRQPGRPLSESNYQETLAPPQDDYGQPPSSDGHGSTRQTSGEWGVALGSPAHDGSFSQQQQQPQRASYSNDPYLSAGGVDQRGKSGVYSNDPYAAYHSGDQVEEIDYHQAADDMGFSGGQAKTRSNWV